MRLSEMKLTDVRQLKGVTVVRQDDPTTAIQIQQVQELLESHFRIRPVPLLRPRGDS